MTFIIAEVGSNWTSFEDAKDSISMAKNVGADAVKFQLYTQKALYGHEWDCPAPMWELPLEWIPKLAEKAAACDIEFMCSAFSPELLKLVDPYVKRHKIASAELTYPELLLAAKETGKPILLSTGGSSLTDIGVAIELIEGLEGNTEITLMYCVSAYPAKNVNLSAIDRLRLFRVAHKYACKVGYSCHTTDWYTPVAAVKYHGATVIEKHFKLRDMDTPDSPHSLNPEEFKEMVDAIKGKSDGVSFPDPQERAMLTRHNRRLIATADIRAGELLEYGRNFGCYRAISEDIHGLHGFAYRHISGKTCKEPLKAGDPITPRHIA